MQARWFHTISSLLFSHVSDEEPEMTEIWFVPTDETTIESIFDAMKQCQSLHPDPERKLIHMSECSVPIENNIFKIYQSIK